MSSQALLESFDDLEPETDDFMSEVLNGLRAAPKTLPCKFFYDEKGSKLFDQICDLPEYYPTRTETALLEKIGGEVAECIGPHAQIVEYGCGSVKKIRPVVDALDRPVAYVAVDISKEHLLAASSMLATDYPDLEVHAICADFVQPFPVTPPTAYPDARRVGFFPGSTLGNFTKEEARALLSSAAKLLGFGGGMLIGIDLKKDVSVLKAAYDDAAGVTAAFNMNLLDRINRELGGDFDLDQFEHHVVYNDVIGRIEMHLRSLCDQTVTIDGNAFEFRAGETIHTENSHKYDIEQFRAMARDAGFEPERVWTDADNLFSVHFLTVP